MSIPALPQPDPNRLRTTLKELLEVDSPTGATADMEAEMQRRLSAFDVQIQTGQRGNVLATLGAGTPMRGLAAHLDTLGAMVQQIRPNGRLELTALGHWSVRFAEGARVTVCTESGPIRGTILPLLSSGHAYNEAVDTAPIGWDQVELRLDVSTKSKAQTQAVGVQPGDVVTVDPQPEFLPNGYLVSRFLDNKAAIACMLEMLHLIQDNGLEAAVPVCLAFTNAEEVGQGAGTCLPRSVTDLVSVDIAPVAANQNSSEHAATLGFKDQSGPHHRSLLLALERLARQHDIPTVRDVFRYYHSDCSSIQKAGYDTRTALLGFGTESTHGYERTHMDSLEAVTRLMLAWVLSKH